jgi:hypothetical protein
VIDGASERAAFARPIAYPIPEDDPVQARLNDSRLANKNFEEVCKKSGKSPKQIHKLATSVLNQLGQKMPEGWNGGAELLISYATALGELSMGST